MADDEIIQKVKFEVDPGTVEQDAADIGRKSGKAITDNLKASAQLSNIFGQSPDELGRKIAPGISGAVSQSLSKLNLSTALERMIGDVDFDKTDFGKKLEKTFRESSQRGMSAGAVQQQFFAPTPERGRAGEGFREAQQRLTETMHPIIGGLEALGMFLKGAPIDRVVDTAVKPFVEEARKAREDRQRERGGGGILPTAAEPSQPFELGAPRRPVPPPPPPPPGFFAQMLSQGPSVSGGLLGAGVGSLFGATAGGGIGGFLGGTPGAAFGIGIQKIIELAGEAAEKIKEMGEHGAETVLSLNEMAEAMGTSVKNLREFQALAAHAGVDFEKLSPILARVALAAQRQLPHIQRLEAESADKILESDIKVRESKRAVEKAIDDRAAAEERVTERQGELLKIQTTGEAERVQAAEAAQLRISGAQVALQGAQMRQREAQVNLQFAPREAALADIQGPLTVEGAKLGVAGARIAAEEARAQYRKFAYGEQEDPETVRERNERKALNALRVAEHNLKESQLKEQQATLAEEKRQATIGAGAGPEAKAQLAAQEAAQAEQQAQLAVKQAQTAQENLAIQQQTKTYAMQVAEAYRALRDAIIAQKNVLEPKPEVEARRAERAREELRYTEPSEIRRGIRGELRPGETPYDVLRMDPQAVRRMLLEESKGRIIGPGGALEGLSKIIREQLGGEEGTRDQIAKQFGLIGAMVPGARAFGKYGGLQGEEALRNLLLQSPEEQRRFLNEPLPGRLPGGPQTRSEQLEAEAKMVEAERKHAEDFRSKEATKAFEKSQRDLATEVHAIQPAEKVSGVQDIFSSAKQGIEGGAVKLIEAITKPTTALDNFNTNLNNINSTITGIINSLSGKGSKETGGGGGGGGPKEVREAPPLEQAGGFISGPGHETSDSIPIMASRGEYMIRAAAVNRIGIPFLNALNSGKYAEGGSVNPDSDVGLGGVEPLPPGSSRLGMIQAGGVPYRGSVAERERNSMGLGPPDNADGGWSDLPRGGGGGRRGPSGLSSIERAWDASLRSHFAEGGSVEGSEYWQWAHDRGLDPDSPKTRELYRQRIRAPKSPSRPPSGPSGGGVGGTGQVAGTGEIARGEIHRGPAGPISIAAAFPDEIGTPASQGHPRPGESLQDVIKRITDQRVAERERYQPPTPGQTKAAMARYGFRFAPTDSDLANLASARQFGGERGKVGVRYAPDESHPLNLEELASARQFGAGPQSGKVGISYAPQRDMTPEEVAKSEALAAGESAPPTGGPPTDEYGPPLGIPLPPSERQPDDKPKQEIDWGPIQEASGGLIGMQEGGSVDGDESGGSGLSSLMKWTVAPHVAGMVLHAIAKRFHIPLPGITDPTSRAMYLGGEGGKDVKVSDVVMAAIPGLEMLDIAKKDAEQGSPMRTALRKLFGIDDPNEPAPWEPGGSFHPPPPPPEEPPYLEQQGGLIGGRGGVVMAANVANPQDSIEEWRRRQLFAAMQSLVSARSGDEASNAMHSLEGLRGMAEGGFIGGFADAVNMPGFAEGGSFSVSSGNGGGAESYHQLDLRTDQGNFRVQVPPDTMEALRSSTLGSKMTATGSRPSWYS